MKYTVKFREVLEREVAIEAGSPEEAQEIAEKMYRKEEVVLDWSDLTESDIVVMTLKQKEAIKQALWIIDLEEFDLCVDDTKGVFKLEDTTGANLGGIESDEFDNLADVIDRLDTYHNDYFYNEDVSEGAYKEERAFLESDESCELLSSVTPSVYKEYMEVEA